MQYRVYPNIPATEMGMFLLRNRQTGALRDHVVGFLPHQATHEAGHQLSIGDPTKACPGFNEKRCADTTHVTRASSWLVIVKPCLSS